MTWAAVERYGLTPAPVDLALVHDLLGTASFGRPRLPDLLADLVPAQAWVAAVSDRRGLDDVGRATLRALRDALAGVIDARDHGGDPPTAVVAPVRAELALQADGRVVLRPMGSSADEVVGRVLAQVRDAQRSGTWERLKTCRNPRCRGPFYDRSRNASGVWHDVTTCGNAANLRAARARRRRDDGSGPARTG